MVNSITVDQRYLYTSVDSVAVPVCSTILLEAETENKIVEPTATADLNVTMKLLGALVV